MRVRWLARLLLPALLRLAESRPPDFRVVKNEGRDTYLRRWWIVRRNDRLNVYLHNMLGDDDAHLHDHPYWSLSLVLTDGLLERYSLDPREERENAGTLEVYQRRPRQGDLIVRSSTMAHQLVVESPAWTLFLTGPRVREWGFWCPAGWRPWRAYAAPRQRADGSHESSVGVGCGETE